MPVRIRVAVLKAARVFASDWAAGGGRWATRMPATSWRAVVGKRLAFGGGARAAWRRRVDAAALAWRAGRVVAVVPRLAKPASNDFDSCIGLPFW
ncbi:hypothetical protein [Burkholderia pseudomallei]|uniref:hypothetical protein n=1 Tax=Burkholderia pseudomallei TaxID=28450 RepID=UPI001F16D873|nr:hypothetical protein [Burkholderia pseudomallei]